MSDVFSDTEPEDEYDVSDRIEERMRVISLIVAARQGDMDRHHRAARRIIALRLLGDAEEFLADLAQQIADLFGRLDDDD